MMFLFAVAVLLAGLPFVVYLLYFLLVLKTNKKKQFLEELKSYIESSIDLSELPKVTVLMPVYNEKEVIYTKIKNISELNYPKDKIEVVIVDDNSSDDTPEIAKAALKDFSLEGEILRNPVRSGVNVSYNRAIPEVSSEYILTTDADALVPTDSLLNLVKILARCKDLGAVAARMIPVEQVSTAATRAAEAYAASYNSMLTAESALFSTFPGSTSCLLMRKYAFSPISSFYGSSDGNISLSIIRNGFRFIFAPDVTYYEPISTQLHEQRRQKIRRATRLIQSTFLNTDMLFKSQYREFGKRILPLRFLMMTLCPVLFFTSMILLFLFVFLNSLLVFAVLLSCAIMILILGAKTDFRILNLIASFFIHQAYVCAGLFLSYRKMTVWKGIERKPQEIGSVA